MRALAAIALLLPVGCGGGGEESARDRGDLDRRLIEPRPPTTSRRRGG